MVMAKDEREDRLEPADIAAQAEAAALIADEAAARQEQDPLPPPAPRMDSSIGGPLAAEGPTVRPRR